MHDINLHSSGQPGPEQPSSSDQPTTPPQEDPRVIAMFDATAAAQIESDPQRAAVFAPMTDGNQIGNELTGEELDEHCTGNLVRSGPQRQHTERQVGTHGSRWMDPDAEPVTKILTSASEWGLREQVEQRRPVGPSFGKKRGGSSAPVSSQGHSRSQRRRNSR